MGEYKLQDSNTHEKYKGGRGKEQYTERERSKFIATKHKSKSGNHRSAAMNQETSVTS